MPDLSPAAERELAAVDDALAGRAVEPDLAGLADLALLLRDDRPAPTPRFSDRLDRDVRLGFPRGGPGRRPSRARRAAHWLTPALGLAAAAALLVALVTALPSGT